MLFSEIPGNQPLKQKIITSIRNDKLPHALLLLGEQGSANLAFALAIAQYVNCKNPSNEDACGNCKSCLQMKKSAHPDLHFTFPVIGSKVISQEFITEWRAALNTNPYLSEFDWYKSLNVENKQGNINKLECLEIIKFTGLKTNANHKVVIIWKPEKLKKEGNILLKTIEEPPQKTLIILVASQTDEILGTILSRTQLISVPPVKDEAIVSFVQQKNPKADFNNIKFANGNIGKAINIADNTESNNQKEEQLALWLRYCIKKDSSKINEWVDQISKSGREYQKNFIEYFSNFYRIAVRSKLSNVSSEQLSEREQNMAQFLLRYMQWDEIEKWADNLENAHYYILRNVNAKILFFNLSLTLVRLMSKK